MNCCCFPAYVKDQADILPRPCISLRPLPRVPWGVQTLKFQSWKQQEPSKTQERFCSIPIYAEQAKDRLLASFSVLTMCRTEYFICRVNISLFNILVAKTHYLHVWRFWTLSDKHFIRIYKDFYLPSPVSVSSIAVDRLLLSKCSKFIGSSDWKRPQFHAV